MRRIITATAVALAFIVLLSLSLPASSTIKIRLTEIVAPLQEAVNGVFHGLGSVVTGVGRVIMASRLNREMEEKLDFLSQEVIRLKEVERENQTLKELLEFKTREPYPGVTARVIGRDVSHWYQSIVINKGGADGVRKDAAVVSSQGVVGKVVEVAPHISRVLLIVDRNSRVGAVLQNSRLTGIVEGLSRGRCVLKYLPRRTAIEAGEVVLTSGLGEVYPPGLILGKITRVYAGKFGLDQYADLEPATDFDRLEQVMVLGHKGQ